jgi:hypothetical protein
VAGGGGDTEPWKSEQVRGVILGYAAVAAQPVLSAFVTVIVTPWDGL